VAAWLARRLTVATLRELTEPFGLSHPDSVRNLLNRADRMAAKIAFDRGACEERRNVARKTFHMCYD